MKKMTQNLRNAIISDILKIVSIKSFTDTDGISKCQTEIAKIANALGFNVSVLGKGRVLVIEPKTAKKIPELGIITHLDTVPFNTDEWTHNPLGEISNGRIYGRGVLDDKAAIILSLYAFYLLEEKIHPSWQILIGSSEEGEWVDMEAYLSEGHVLPKFSATIDGDGIQNGSKGYLDLELKFYRDSNLKQISEFYVLNGFVNAVPEKAVAVINGSKIGVTGKAAHSSIPEAGKNALIDLACKINKDFQPPEFSNFFEMMELLKTSSNATILGFEEKPTVLNDQYVGFTTICPTMCSLEQDCLSVNLNIRLCPGTTSEDVYQAMKTISSKFDCTCYIKKLEYPVFVPQNSKGIQYMLESYKEVLGIETTSMISNGIGYNASIPNCVIFGPRFADIDDEIDTCHATDENRRIDDLFKFFDMLVLFCEKYLSK